MKLRPSLSSQVSLASYRDELCRHTITSAFERATFPDRVFVAAVQQNGPDDVACLHPFGAGERAAGVGAGAGVDGPCDGAGADQPLCARAGQARRPRRAKRAPEIPLPRILPPSSLLGAGPLGA